MDTNALSVSGLSKQYDGRFVVDDCSFTVPSGSICGFLGRNGAGKSTTLRMLMNLIQPSSGKASLLGLDSRTDHRQLMQRVGYVAEAPVLYDWMTVRQIVRFTAGFYPRWNHSRLESLLLRFGIGWKQKVRDLSRGGYAQLALALAMGHDPELLILDEPATGLDLVVRRDFLTSMIQLIQEEGRTVLFSSHLIHEVERVADQVIVMDRGRVLVASSLDDLKSGIRRMVVRPGAGCDLTAAIPGVLRSCRDAGDYVLTVQDNDGGARRALEDAGNEVMETTGLSLEEIFIDLVGAGAQEMTQ